MKKDEDLLRAILEEHARNPQGRGKLLKVSHAGEWQSPKTGNSSKVQIETESNRMVRLVAQVEGSALANACASIMCSELEGGSINFARSILQDLEKWIEHRTAPVAWKGDLVVYESLVQFPERMDCAMLCWRSLQIALKN